jgi:excisionase family DNA binding protein
MEGYHMLQNNPDLSELFNTQFAAQYLGVTVSTLEVWRSTKRYPLPYVKVGRLVKYRRADLDAFLESRTVGAGA